MSTLGLTITFLSDGLLNGGFLADFVSITRFLLVAFLMGSFWTKVFVATVLRFGLTVSFADVLMARFGWVSTAQLKEARGYVIVGAFVLAAIFTPPDIISQFMLAVPLWLLYEAGILFVQVTGSKQKSIHAKL